MRRALGRLLLGAAATAAAAFALTRWPAPAGAAAGRAPAAAYDHGWRPDMDRDAVWSGVAGCASSSCHAVTASAGAKRGEYGTWAGRDKHAQAFQVLYNDRSRRIVRNLYGDGAAAATETALCLKCHASHDGVRERTEEGFSLADGVGCESCHGGSGRWLTEHYRAGFKERSLEEKATLGLRPTKDLAHRAKLCAECHVGTPEKEVNHDLIAAGHPRLGFELGAYLGIYPKHWSHADERARYPDFEARAWAVGQVASAQSALELLAARAGGERPWPEFSEYGCFACHKDLTVSKLGKDAPTPRPGYAGSLPWQTWYFSDAFGPARDAAGGPDTADGLGQLRKLMERPSPTAAPVRREAAGLARTLGGWLVRLESAPGASPEKVQALMAGLAREGRRAKALDWDGATQLYLGFAALHQGLEELDPRALPPGSRADLAALRGELAGAFPPGYDSPKGFRAPTAERLLAPLARTDERLGNR